MKIFSLIQNHKLRTLFTVLIISTLIFANFTVLSNAGGNSASTNVISAVSTVDNITLLLTSVGVLTLEPAVLDDYEKPLTRAEFARMLVMASPYKDLVGGKGIEAAHYKDVGVNTQAAAYIYIAAAKGLLPEYGEGYFAPDKPVTLEQGVNSALKLLGYSEDDFNGEFPYAQMTIYQDSGLSNNISGGIGTVMKKKDAANLIFNMMAARIKDDSKSYVETLSI